MVLRTWRIYARLDDNGNPIEFSYVSCLLRETKNFILWELVRGTREDAQRAVNKNKILHLEEKHVYPEIR